MSIPAPGGLPDQSSVAGFEKVVFPAWLVKIIIGCFGLFIGC